MSERLHGRWFFSGDAAKTSAGFRRLCLKGAVESNVLNLLVACLVHVSSATPLFAIVGGGFYLVKVGFGSVQHGGGFHFGCACGPLKYTNCKDIYTDTRAHTHLLPGR